MGASLLCRLGRARREQLCRGCRPDYREPCARRCRGVGGNFCAGRCPGRRYAHPGRNSTMSIAGGTDMARVLARTAPGLQASIVNESIRFESRGAVLVIGPGQYVTSVAARLAVSLRVLACATNGEISPTDLHDNPSLLSCR